MKLQSPCKTCDKYMCDEPKHCDLRWEYVQKVGKPEQQAVDQDTTYQIILR